MTEPRAPMPHHIYREEVDLESFQVTRMMNMITAQVTFVQDVTPIPQQGQIVEFHVLGTTVQGIVDNSSLLDFGDELQILILATRIRG